MLHSLTHFATWAHSRRTRFQRTNSSLFAILSASFLHLHYIFASTTSAILRSLTNPTAKIAACTYTPSSREGTMFFTVPLSAHQNSRFARQCHSHTGTKRGGAPVYSQDTGAAAYSASYLSRSSSPETSFLQHRTRNRNNHQNISQIRSSKTPTNDFAT